MIFHKKENSNSEYIATTLFMQILCCQVVERLLAKLNKITFMVVGVILISNY